MFNDEDLGPHVGRSTCHSVSFQKTNVCMRCFLSCCLWGNLQTALMWRGQQAQSHQTRWESFARAKVPFVLILSSNCRFGFYWCCCIISPQLIALLWEKLLLDCVSGGGDKREDDKALSGPRKIRQEQSEFKIFPPSPTLSLRLSLFFRLSWPTHQLIYIIPVWLQQLCRSHSLTCLPCYSNHCCTSDVEVYLPAHGIIFLVNGSVGYDCSEQIIHWGCN